MSSSSGSRVPTGAKNGGSGRSNARSPRGGAFEHEQRIGERGRSARRRAGGHAGTTHRHRGAFRRSSTASCGASQNRSVSRDLQHRAERQHGARHARRSRTPRAPTAPGAASIAASASDVIRLPPADSPATATRYGSPPSSAIRDAIQRVRAARVLDRGRERMLRREPVADVDDEVAEPREHQAHQPVRVLRQQVERAAVHVEHDRPRLRADGSGGRCRGGETADRGPYAMSGSSSTPWRFGDAAGCSRPSPTATRRTRSRRSCERGGTTCRATRAARVRRSAARSVSRRCARLRRRTERSAKVPRATSTGSPPCGCNCSRMTNWS